MSYVLCSSVHFWLAYTGQVTGRSNMPSVPELNAPDVGSLFHPNVSADRRHTYDYIVVGGPLYTRSLERRLIKCFTGGTAGCVLASRLSEDPHVTVLLIEQGPIADTWSSRVPLISGNPYRSGTVAKTWWSLPLRDADNRYLEVMRGEALGGTSRINSLLYTRGA